MTAIFTPPTEKLAFHIKVEGEADFREIWSEPLPEVVRILQSANDYLEVFHNLPDVEIV